MQSELLTEALRRFDLSEASYSEWRRDATADLRFCADQQWDDAVSGPRHLSGRPCLTADRIAPAIRQIVNESRQNRPSIEVNPKSDGADEDTAHLISGLIRDIEYQSSADAAYDTAEEYAVKCGLGYFRLVAEYDDCESFDQNLVIKVVDDPLTVYMDPDHREADGSDQEYAFIVKNLSKEAYIRAYGESSLAKRSNWKGKDLSYTGWVQPDAVRVAEYFYKEYERQKIYHVAEFIPNSAGQLQFYQERVVTEKPTDDDIVAQRVVILNTRSADKVVIKWCVLNGHEVIEEKEFPGEHIPVFPVKGEDFWVNGKRVIMGAVRRAKDTQKIINYAVSNQVEAIELSNKVPYIGAAGQFDTFEDKWRDMNHLPLPYVEYNAMDINGHPVPPPQRNAFEASIQAIAATRQQSDDDLKAIFGIFEAARGEASNETSGIAIISRQRQSSNSNYHFYDNLVRAIKHLGRVIVNCLPTYYDTPRTIRIVKPGGEQELVAINQFIQDKEKKYDFSTGRYDVIVKTGPTYATKREELVKSGVALIQQYPQAGPLIADLLVAASDFQGNQEIAARLRTQVPPEVLAATGEDGQVVGDPKKAIAALQQQLTQSKKSLEELNAYAVGMEKLAKDTAEELKLEKAGKEVELRKNDQTYDIAAQNLALEQAKLELAWQSAQMENSLAERQLAVQEGTMQIKAVTAASNLVKPEKTINTISKIKPISVPTVTDQVSDKDFSNGLDHV